MANEIMVGYGRTGRTLYAIIRNQTSGYVWNTSGGTGAYEAFASGNWGVYDVGLTEQGVAGFYQGNVPAAGAAGVLGVVAHDQAGADPAQTDPVAATGDVQWGGTAVVPHSDLATSGQVGNIAPLPIAHGVAVSGMMVKLVSSADHVTPFTSGVVSGQISRNGGAFGALQSGLAVAAYTERGFGFYSLNLTSGDLAGRVIALHVAAVGISGGTSDPVDLVFVTQKTSGN